MPTPPTNYPIAGRVYDAESQLIAGATVLLTHENGTLTVTSNSSGEYILNLADLSSWSLGDEVTIKASKTTYGQKTETITISGSSYELNLTLEYTSNLVIQSSGNYLLRNASALIDFEGNKITPANPLPVKTTDLLGGYALSGSDDSNQIYGYVNKDGNWYIQKYNSSDLTYVYARGSSDFLTNWAARTSLSYVLFNEVF